MQVIATTGNEDVALVYIAKMSGGRPIEFAESIQPPIPREKKWVLLVSTMFGCPIGCQICDAGGCYQGTLTKEELIEQLDFLVYRRFPDGQVPVKQFKIQFARMGEPSLNPAVLDVLDELPKRYRAPGLMPSLSTVAPLGRQEFFERLLANKQACYPQGRFQLQFSIHTTDVELRDKIIPCGKWTFENIAEYGERFYAPGDRKISLNFALICESPVDPKVLLRYFDPGKFLIKLTPLNPTYRARENKLIQYVSPVGGLDNCEMAQELRDAGFEVIVSVGELEENCIGSNCGQYIRRHLLATEPIDDAYTYSIRNAMSEPHGSESDSTIM
ncbi:MAG TPA: radical SAM protein [bacterium]|nr:radical SAM protein [bacterium]